MIHISVVCCTGTLLWRVLEHGSATVAFMNTNHYYVSQMVIAPSSRCWYLQIEVLPTMILSCLQASNWHYCIRIPCDTLHGIDAAPVASLIYPKKRVCFYRNVGLWQDGYLRCNLLLLIQRVLKSIGPYDFIQLYKPCGNILWDFVWKNYFLTANRVFWTGGFSSVVFNLCHVCIWLLPVLHCQHNHWYGCASYWFTFLCWPSLEVMGACHLFGRLDRQQSIQISTTVSQHLRNILLVPLSAWDFGAAVNLFDGWFYRPRANRTNLFCLVVLVVDDAVTVLVEVVDKILSLFSGAISKQSLCRINLPCQSKVSACLKRFNDPPPCANSPVIPIENLTFTVRGISSMMFQTPSCPSLNRWLVRQLVVDPLYGHRCLGNMPR